MNTISSQKTGYGSIDSYPTTDSSTVTIASFPLDEIKTVLLMANISGMKTDATGAAARRVNLAFARRESAGNITLVDSVQYGTLVEDNAASAAITVDVDTATQTMRIRVTSGAAENWNWKAQYWLVYS